MTLPLLTAVAPRWEVELAGALSRSGQVHVVRRCADVGELLGVAAAGLGRVALVSSDLRALDRAVLDALLGIGLLLHRWRVWTLRAQLLLMLGYTVLISACLPHYWFDPYMAVGKNLVLMVASLWLLWLEKGGGR